MNLQTEVTIGNISHWFPQSFMRKGGVKSVHTVKFHRLRNSSLSFFSLSRQTFFFFFSPSLVVRCKWTSPGGWLLFRAGTVKCRNTQGSAASTAPAWGLLGSRWGLLVLHVELWIYRVGRWLEVLEIAVLSLWCSTELPLLIIRDLGRGSVA